MGIQPSARRALLGLGFFCATCTPQPERDATADFRDVVAEVEERLWLFHSADTARDAEGVIGLLWPDFEMLADGARLGYADAVEGSRQFMPTLEVFHTEWTEVQITPLGPTAAVSSFLFADSLVTRDGAVTLSRGPTTFVWQKREGEWRVLFADSDHYALDP